jgi:hypothetical protein
MATVSLLVFLVVPEHASAKVKAQKLWIDTTSGKHIDKGKITVRNQGARQQPSKTAQPPGSGSTRRR